VVNDPLLTLSISKPIQRCSRMKIFGTTSLATVEVDDPVYLNETVRVIVVRHF